MKYLIILLCSYSLAQTPGNRSLWAKIPDDAKHFYGAFTINEASYQIQSLAFPDMKEAQKVLIANGITILCVFGKEYYDERKPHPTHDHIDDIVPGVWSIPIYDIFNICRTDVKKRIEEEKRLSGYYNFR
jgi:hypothetical protein